MLSWCFPSKQGIYITVYVPINRKVKMTGHMRAIRSTCTRIRWPCEVWRIRCLVRYTRSHTAVCFQFRGQPNSRNLKLKTRSLQLLTVIMVNQVVIQVISIGVLQYDLDGVTASCAESAMIVGSCHANLRFEECRCLTDLCLTERRECSANLHLKKKKKKVNQIEKHYARDIWNAWPRRRGKRDSRTQ